MKYKEFKEHFLSGALLGKNNNEKTFSMVKNHRIVIIRKDFINKLFKEIGVVWYLRDYFGRVNFLPRQGNYKPCGYTLLFVDDTTLEHLQNLE